MQLSLRTAWSLGLAALASAALLAPASAGAKEFFKLATLGPGSSPYTVMTTFANVINTHLKDYEIQVNATGVATRHAIDAAEGNLDFFMSAPVVQDAMEHQTQMYAKLPEAPALSKKLRGVLNFPIGVYHIVVYDKSGIKSLADVKGKRVFLGPPGGAAPVIAMQMIEGATGLKPDKDYTSVKLGWEAAAQAFQDQQLDVYINPTNAPSAVIAQMALTSKIRLLGLTPADFAKPEMSKLLHTPGRTREEIASGTYGANQVNKDPVESIGSIVGIGTRASMPDDVIYKVTKTFWEHLDEVHAVAPWMKQIKFENALAQMNMPLHPGALRYYRERGVEIPENLIPK